MARRQPLGRGRGVDDDQRRARARAPAPRRAARRCASPRRHATSTTAASGFALVGPRPGGRRQLGVAQHDDRRIAPRLARQILERGGQRGRPTAPSSSLTPAKAFSTSSPRVRERRNPASRLMCARSSASTSGSGRGSTAATSRANAWPSRGRIAVADQHEVGEGAQLARGGQRIAPAVAPDVEPFGRADRGSPGRTTRRPAAPAPRRATPPPARTPRSSARRRCGCVRGGRRARRGSAPVRRARRCGAPPAARAGHRCLASSNGIATKGEGRRGDLRSPRLGGSDRRDHQVNPGLVRVKIDLSYLERVRDVGARPDRNRARSHRRVGPRQRGPRGAARRARRARASPAGSSPAGGGGGALRGRLLARAAADAADDGEEVALTRTGGAIARWISFPRGVRFATAATSTAAAALAAWGMLAMAGERSRHRGGGGRRGDGALRRLGAAGRADRQPAAPPDRAPPPATGSPSCARSPTRASVAVRGVVVARRTAASALDGRAAVWSLARFRQGRLVHAQTSSTRPPSTSCSTTAPTSRSGSRSRAACCSIRSPPRSASSSTARRCWRSSIRS